MFISASVYMCHLFNKKMFVIPFGGFLLCSIAQDFFNQQIKQIILVIILFLIPIDIGHA